MYAIVNIAGQQFKVMNNQKIFVNRLEGKEDSSVTFDDVLLIDDDGKVIIGTPKIEGAAVSAKILQHMKADKVLVFKKKRRKGYKTLNGHRQLLTKIQIEKIEEKASKPARPTGGKAAPKKESTEKIEKAAVTKSSTKQEEIPAAKKAAPKATAKKTVAKKPAAKKATAKKTTKKKKKKDA